MRGNGTQQDGLQQFAVVGMLRHPGWSSSSRAQAPACLVASPFVAPVSRRCCHGLPPPMPLAPAACNITALLLRENRIGPLYLAAKTYICCDGGWAGGWVPPMHTHTATGVLPQRQLVHQDPRCCHGLSLAGTWCWPQLTWRVVGCHKGPHLVHAKTGTHARGLPSHAVADAIYSVWVPWTVVSVLTLVFALLASVRVVTSTVLPVGRGVSRQQFLAAPVGAPPT